MKQIYREFPRGSPAHASKMGSIHHPQKCESLIAWHWLRPNIIEAQLGPLQPNGFHGVPGTGVSASPRKTLISLPGKNKWRWGDKYFLWSSQRDTAQERATCCTAMPRPFYLFSPPSAFTHLPCHVSLVSSMLVWCREHHLVLPVSATTQYFFLDQAW